MAGTLKVDTLNADSNLALKIANTAVAYIDSTGLKMSGSNLQFSSGGTLAVGRKETTCGDGQVAGCYRRRGLNEVI